MGETVTLYSSMPLKGVICSGYVFFGMDFALSLSLSLS